MKLFAFQKYVLRCIACDLGIPSHAHVLSPRGTGKRFHTRRLATALAAALEGMTS